MESVKIPFLLPLLSYFLPNKCAKEFADISLTLFCFKILVSKTLGYGIIAGSVAVKLPQIIKILKCKSAVGISFTGQLLDLIGVSSTVAYSISSGYPFSSYGEGTFLALQTSLIAMLVIFFQKSRPLSMGFLAGYGLLMSYMCSPMVPPALLKVLMRINIPIVAGGKLSQAWINYSNRSTGQLSGITLGLIFVGSVARIFTTLQETGDMTIAVTFVVSAALNLLLVLQMLAYWKNTVSNCKSSGVKRARKTKAKKI